MNLIAGLGNPGAEYTNTRHNVGYMVIGHWAKSLGVRLSGRRFHSTNIQTKYQDRDIVLLRPKTYMNRSGRAVKACVDFYGLAPEDILVVHDDIDLTLGRVKMVRDGGPGGHKGVRSLIQDLGTRAFCRVKVGVGRPPAGEAVEDYVLSPFRAGEKDIVRDAVNGAVLACELYITNGVEAAMNKINCQNFTNQIKEVEI
ncbi:aminoacyl-tRNA hydrolase [Thermodesulfobacteriota bacterium]